MEGIDLFVKILEDRRKEEEFSILRSASASSLHLENEKNCLLLNSGNPTSLPGLPIPPPLPTYDVGISPMHFPLCHFLETSCRFSNTQWSNLTKEGYWLQALNSEALFQLCSLEL